MERSNSSTPAGQKITNRVLNEDPPLWNSEVQQIQMKMTMMMISHRHFPLVLNISHH